MSKKSKKRSSSTHRKSSSELGQQTLIAVSSDQTINRSYLRTQGSGEFNPDYSYVIRDLKRIGIMAGSFFLILIALSFFLR